PLRGARRGQLGDTRQALRDVISGCDATRVEGTHRQLGSGLTDRLRRDDADGITDLRGLAGRHRAAVAGLAHAGRRLALEYGANRDGRDLALLHLRSERLD